MTKRRKPSKRRTPAPLIAVDTVASRGEVGKLLARIVEEDPRTQVEIAALAGITDRQLRNAMKGYPDTALYILRAMGYDVTETIHVKGEPDGKE